MTICSGSGSVLVISNSHGTSSPERVTFGYFNVRVYPASSADSVQTESADEAGYTLTLKYPKVTRSGLDVPWELDITSTEPLPEQIVIAVTGDYFDIFDHQGLDPEAYSQTADDEMEYWTFNTPGGATMSISIDQYVEPGAMTGSSGTVGLFIDGELTAPITFTTRMLP